MTNKIRFWEAVATLVGTIIGAGVLGLPYAINAFGLIPGFLMLLVLGVAALFLNLMFAEIVLRTRYRHQIAGYAKEYLGNFMYRLETAALLIGGYGALTAYIIGEGGALAALFGGNPFFYSVIFFIIVSIILFIGLKVVKVFELWMVLIFLAVIAIIFGFSAPAIDFSGWQKINLANWFMPYGVILFAYGGAASIVSLREILRGKERLVKRAVFTASLIPIVVYCLFAIIVIGVTGADTTKIATIGLGEKFGPLMAMFCNLFAFFAMGTSFLTVGLSVKQFFHFDVKMSKTLAWFATVAVPAIMFFIGTRDFIKTMEIAGSIAFGITGINIVWTYWRAKRRGDRAPEFSLPKLKIVGIVLIMLFIAGIGYTVYDLVLGFKI
ncbi:hypothetical protein HZB94_00230 [Candidatus Falkowbacteria bacterium]|nr:hypothetical protein [Candidatus Falkowbacteria bacterium]